jgi:hypothetical protein
MPGHRGAHDRDAHDRPATASISAAAAGRRGDPVLVFCMASGRHSSDELLEHFSDRYRCVAPTCAATSGRRRRWTPERIVPSTLADISGSSIRSAGRSLVAHDWGGRSSGDGAQRPEAIRRRHRQLAASRHVPASCATTRAQQAAARIRTSCRPDAKLPQRKRFRRLGVLHQHGRRRSGARRRWLTTRFATISHRHGDGLRGGVLLPCFPPRPPLMDDAHIRDRVRAGRGDSPPTLVVRAGRRPAGGPLPDGRAYVRSACRRVPGATHWTSTSGRHSCRRVGARSRGASSAGQRGGMSRIRSTAC